MTKSVNNLQLRKAQNDPFLRAIDLVEIDPGYLVVLVTIDLDDRTGTEFLVQYPHILLDAIR